jgi:hypothetical protein
MQGLRWHYEDHEATVAIRDEKQHQIGWQNMFRGWIDKSWQQWQENHIHKTFPEDRKTRDKAKMWSVYLIDGMLQEGFEQWKGRCDKVHKKIKRNETHQARIVINSKVTALYTLAMDVGYRDRHHIFSKSFEDKLKESVYQFEIWTATTTPAVKQAAHDFKRRTKANTKDIRKYMGVPITPIKQKQTKTRKKTIANKSMADTTTITDHPT